ncbi:hypothetical protein Mapa_006025 [Marchantia paleacea]|nr:hypothetical protein Mapa_006025 [Marchantia paleacea]
MELHEAVHHQHLAPPHVQHPGLELHQLGDQRAELERHVEVAGAFLQLLASLLQVLEIGPQGRHSQLGRPARAQRQGLQERWPLHSVPYLEIQHMDRPLLLHRIEQNLIAGQMAELADGYAIVEHTESLQHLGLGDALVSREPLEYRRGVFLRQPSSESLLEIGSQALHGISIRKDMSSETHQYHFSEFQVILCHGLGAR